MAICRTEVSEDGFEVIRLSNSRVCMTLLPELGGKIYQLVDLQTGRDWLWKNPHIALRRPAPGMDYDSELDSGGWDEVLFSVKACRLELPGDHRMSIGDHGNAVDRAWQLTETSRDGGEAVCELVAHGQAPCFELHRRVALHATQPQLNISYRLVNTGPVAWPWLWCAHPLLAIEDGMRIEMQSGQEIRLPQSSASADPAKHAWPDLFSRADRPVRMDNIFADPAVPKAFCQKLFVRSNGLARLSTADHAEQLEIRYDAHDLPWVALWINKRGWSGTGAEPYLNLGMEPATSPNDCLTEAIKAGEARQLDPGRSTSWSLTLTLRSGKRP